MWATPRTVSTAFDKMMRSRGSHHVLTEPFSVPWYFGPEQRSDRFPVTEPGATFDSTLAEVLTTARSEPVFVKDMAYHLGRLLRPDVLVCFRNSFIIRDPAWSVPSLLRRWPDASPDEVGYEAQLRAFRICADLTGSAPAVIDSDLLCSDPAAVVSRWCDAMEIAMRPDALTWRPGQPAGWERWSDWFETAAQSTGFLPPDKNPPPPVRGRAAEVVEQCRPAYEELRRHAL